MERAEATGFGVSVVGHCALLAAAWLIVSRPSPPQVSQAFEVSYVDEVGLVNAAPEPSPTPAAAPTALEPAPVENAAPAPEPVVQPTPAPPRPTPRSTPSPRAVPAPPVQQRPARQSGTDQGRQNTRPRIGNEIVAGLGDDSGSRSNRAPATITGPQLASIASAIQRQIQPCASRRANLLGEGASRIRVTLNLRLRPDGTLSATPTLLSGRTTGVDDENRRFVTQVGDQIRAAVRECSPIRNLPAELYNTPTGGWSNINVNFRFPDA